MAIGAIEIVPVIQRFVGQARMLVYVRSPRIRRMAFVAFVVGYKMPCILARRCIAVVTGRTRAQYLCVINGGHRCPGYCGVTVLANVGRQDVGRVLAGRIGAVMAADAVVRNIDVIEVRR